MNLEPAFLSVLCGQIVQATGKPFTLERVEAVGGGCINRTFTLTATQFRYFAKVNAAHRLDMFEAEADGLRELSGAKAIRVPQPVCVGVSSDLAYLVLEHLELSGSPDPAQLGTQLAALHRKNQIHHGWFRDNAIGVTPQDNAPLADWSEFWWERRLRPQFERAYANGYAQLRKAATELAVRLPAFLAAHHPQPSLLHGDLWGGNVGALADGTPVLFDPAVYYGDREADLAMTELFGGFPHAFYAAYNEAWPLDAGYSRRKHLYNLYHLLNHLNLFGEGYFEQVRRCIARL